MRFGEEAIVYALSTSADRRSIGPEAGPLNYAEVDTGSRSSTPSTSPSGSAANSKPHSPVGADEDSATQWSSTPLEEKLDTLALYSATSLLKSVEDPDFGEDIRANEQALAEKVIQRKRKEIQAAIRSFDYSTCSLFDAVAHWFSQKGHSKDWVPWPAHTMEFVYHYLATCGGHYKEDEWLLQSYLQALAFVHKIPLNMLNDTRHWAYPIAIQMAATRNLPARLRVYKFNPFRNAQKTNSDYVADYALKDEPIRSLTTMCEQYDSSAVRVPIDEHAFMKMFDLSPMPQTGPPANCGPRIAYCVYEAHVDELVQTLREALNDDKGEMRPLKKASILDHVFVQ